MVSRIALSLSLLLASMAQYGYSQTGWITGLTVMGMPGFQTAMLVGADGHARHSAAAPYIEFLVNAIFYFLVAGY